MQPRLHSGIRFKSNGPGRTIRNRAKGFQARICGWGISAGWDIRSRNRAYGHLATRLYRELLGISRAIVSGFADHLAVQLESSATPSEPRLFQIAGYVNDTGRIHPEFYFVRNIQGINAKTGEYEGETSNYQVTEDFWARDYPQSQPACSRRAGFQRYFNGFAHGRIAYAVATQKFQQFYEQV